MSKQNGHLPGGFGTGVHPGGVEPSDTWKLIAALLGAQAASMRDCDREFDLLPADERPTFYEFARACGREREWWEAHHRLCDSLDELLKWTSRGGPNDEDYWGNEQAA
jgi:hypothetical protein